MTSRINISGGGRGANVKLKRLGAIYTKPFFPQLFQVLEGGGGGLRV